MAEHVSGAGNTVDDAGSRGFWEILYAYAAACSVRLEEVPLSDIAEYFLAGALEIALEFGGESDQSEQAPPPGDTPEGLSLIHI